MKTPKKICVHCDHHTYTTEYGRVLVCNSPKLGRHAGQIAVTMMREMGNEYQQSSINRNFKEICGREGKWYHVRQNKI